MIDPLLERLTRLHPKLIDSELERTERLLAAVGSPHLKLPPVVHVAGTNGKGSLVAYLRAMAEAAGYRVHVYTSPHLVRFNERIRVAGRLIDDDMLDADPDGVRAGQSGTAHHLLRDHHGRGLSRLRPRAGRSHRDRGRHGRPPRCRPTWSTPALSAITPIGYDHTGFLGDKLEGIAAEKAGILKHAVPAVIGRQREVSARVIADEAGKLAAPLFRMGREWQVTPTAAGFRYDSDLLGLDLPAPALVGAHQIDNAATAVACIERLRAAQFRDRRRGDRQGACVGRLAGPAAEAQRAGRWSRPCRPAASSGSMAATTRIAASRWRARPLNGPGSRRRCRST